VGAIAASGATAAPDEIDPVAKREENLNLVLTAADDDDDDASTGGGSDDTSVSVNRDATGVSRDATNSRFTRVSRDRDYSRGDLTRDWTRDGGDPTRDYSENRTNDRSRNDTR
jgi:hypothetical protein